jgi:N-dimethylarginine dimethylaminohydrolase
VIINSHNDWDSLEEIIVGRADFAHIPPADPSMKNFMYANLTYNEIKKHVGSYDRRVLEGANEDLDILSEVLEDCGVVVHRPERQLSHLRIQTPRWGTTGWHNYCPRDIFLVLGNNIVEVPSVMRSRMFETWSYNKILRKAFDDGAKWFSAPKQIIEDTSFDFSDLSKSTLMNNEILFDAPNVIRIDNDLIFQISNSGNEKGAEWLQRMFPDYKIHIERDAYSGAHFDSTIIPLRKGLVLLNGIRCNQNNYPKFFKNWEKIFFADIVSTNAEDSGISSDSIGLNLLSINPNLVIVDENQKPLIKILEQYKIESIPLSMRHARTLGGGFHCVTLDLKRT